MEWGRREVDRHLDLAKKARAFLGRHVDVESVFVAHQLQTGGEEIERKGGREQGREARTTCSS